MIMRTASNSLVSEPPMKRFTSKQSEQRPIIQPLKQSFFQYSVRPKRRVFRNEEEKKSFIEDYKRKFKTELCKNWQLRGSCKFEDKCCFAHGKEELKVKTHLHSNYKTKPCKQYHLTGYCPYGHRCQYLHKEYLKRLQQEELDKLEAMRNPHKRNFSYVDVLTRFCEQSIGGASVDPRYPVGEKRLEIFERLARNDEEAELQYNWSRSTSSISSADGFYAYQVGEDNCEN
eukprot:TRINITY_DN1042_c0_g1_i1.p1 TRINITY_DN1042_c0_g1~~TRINITY_DN1042_c0_g1_i1.p1  ORF type:complete len:230 (-),score=33.79 TRINITY_DN1042_c0_g1_i1:237-926(-)